MCSLCIIATGCSSPTEAVRIAAPLTRSLATGAIGSRSRAASFGIRAEQQKHRSCRSPVSFLSDYNNGLVDIFWGTVLCQIVYGFSNPNGVTVDAQGNLYVTQNGTSNIVMLKPPYKSVSKTLQDPGEDPASVALCKGYIAVANLGGSSSGASISIYSGSSTEPTSILDDPNAIGEYSATCDGDGNLYTGYLTQSGTGAVNEWLGGSGYPIELANISTGFPGGIQYHRGALWVGDQRTPTITVWLPPFTVASKTIYLQGSDDPVDFVIDGSSPEIVVADAALNDGLLFNRKGHELGSLSGNGGGLAVGIAHFTSR
jgi:hypothetical protein